MDRLKRFFGHAGMTILFIIAVLLAMILMPFFLIFIGLKPSKFGDYYVKIREHESTNTGRLH